MARILLGVSGGIAAYKACELVRLLVKGGPRRRAARHAGCRAVRPTETFLALARRSPDEDLYAHLTRGDLLVVAPCTANTLAKLAHGLADNLLTEAALAHRGPVLLAPAMNPRMWSHPATRANVELLRGARRRARRPRRGRDRRGRVGGRPDGGAGRRSPPAIEQLLAPGSLAGRRVLVTAGGTREAVDAVRFVGNRSSGRMGVALAEEARRRGAEVVLLAANLAVARRPGSRSSPTPTAESMLGAAHALPSSTWRCSPPPSPTTGPPRRSRRSDRRAASRGRSSSSRRPTSRGCSASASGPARCS